MIHNQPSIMQSTRDYKEMLWCQKIITCKASWPYTEWQKSKVVAAIVHSTRLVLANVEVF
jgi:hypothetical protein